MSRYPQLLDCLVSLSVSTVVTLFLLFSAALAETLDDLHPAKTYDVNRITISGNHTFSDSELLAEVKTHARSSYEFWKKRPEFDRDVFAEDLKRLRQFYVEHGYYAARIDYDLQVNDQLVNASIRISEGKPVRVKSVDIRIYGSNTVTSSLYRLVRTRPGSIFDQLSYQRDAESLRKYFLDQSYAYARVERHARVNLTTNQARVEYVVYPEAPATFGPTTVTGTKSVDPEIAARELTYKPGEPFSQRELDKSRERIVKLGLFALVQLKPELTSGERSVPIRLILREKPKHAMDLGFGYNTESQLIADFQWSDRDWLGGGRQLLLTARYSSINSGLLAQLNQPFLFDIRGLNGITELRLDVQQVPTYTLFAASIVPRMEYAFSEHLMAYVGYRFEYAKLTSIDPTVIRALHSVRQSGFLFGPYAGMTLNTSDDPFNPRHGYVLNADVMEGGGAFGGAFNFYRMEAELKHYQPFFWATILATRLKVGTGDSLGPKYDYPLFYRFYAGGEGSVRGYGYWRLGPQSSDNTPLGGLSDIEGSIELRRTLWKQFGGAIFLDFGQLSLHPYDLPVSNLRFAAGPALSYSTPVGPIRIDVGFPINKQPSAPNWQFYFSIGQFF